MILALLLLQAAPAAPWTPIERADAVNQSKSLAAAAVSREQNARLVVRCDDAGDPVVSVQYITKEPLGASPDRAVDLSFDGAAPVSQAWEFPGNAAFVREPNAVTAITVALVKARQVKVHALTLANVAVDATFDAPGGDSQIRSVLSACGYTLGEVPVVTDDAKKKNKK
jgi:hypothetical protein